VGSPYFRAAKGSGLKAVNLLVAQHALLGALGIINAGPVSSSRRRSTQSGIENIVVCR
jgi:hypothetical protein